ncbi:hypothetical protein MP228_010281 [Amoeboaphelidium protococcarum]|nr:hypothetical protein MP228_010281 [Amoeboaphelidium protococcarum]
MTVSDPVNQVDESDEQILLVDDMQVLRKMFYERLFPSEWMLQWLSYGDPAILHNREWSYTLTGSSGEEIYVRYQSYMTHREFYADLCKKNPAKIDIGAVYSTKPKNKSMTKSFKPVQREFVIDIDMTDYDQVRSCCAGADICRKCWTLMTVSIKVIDECLRSDFGFQCLLWVYSGRRGVHLWVADQRARVMNEESRRSVVQYLEVVRALSGDAASKMSYQHPHMSRSAAIIDQYFRGYMLGPDAPKLPLDMLKLVPHEALRQKLSDHWSQCQSAAEQWRVLTEYVGGMKDKKLENCVRNIQFVYMYPRLDAQVSMHLNHLLKSPFCVHPKTGKICVPIDAVDADKFNPLTVPTLNGVIQEMMAHDRSGSSNTQLKDWQKTSLKDFSGVMKRFRDSIDADLKSHNSNFNSSQMDF